MQNKTYTWRSGDTRFGVAPERAAEVFRAIEQRHGTITPEALVNESRPETAPFHAAFDWDDTTAADKYRRTQARQIIGALQVVYYNDASGKELPTRAFVSVVEIGAAPADDHGDDTVTGYMNLDTVMGDGALRRAYVRAAARELASWRRKYADIRELSEVFVAADLALEQLALVGAQ